MAKPIWVASDHAWDKYIKLLAIDFQWEMDGTVLFLFFYWQERKCYSIFHLKKKKFLQIQNHLRAHRAIENVAALVKDWSVVVWALSKESGGKAENRQEDNWYHYPLVYHDNEKGKPHQVGTLDFILINVSKAFYYLNFFLCLSLLLF